MKPFRSYVHRNAFPLPFTRTNCQLSSWNGASWYVSGKLSPYLNASSLVLIHHCAPTHSISFHFSFPGKTSSNWLVWFSGNSKYHSSNYLYIFTPSLSISCVNSVLSFNWFTSKTSTYFLFVYSFLNYLSHVINHCIGHARIYTYPECIIYYKIAVLKITYNTICICSSDFGKARLLDNVSFSVEILVYL